MNQADTTHQPDIMNSEQAREYLQVCRNTFYKLMHAGGIPHTKLGGQLRFSRRQILAMIEAGDTTGEPTTELPQGDRLGPAIARAKAATPRCTPNRRGKLPPGQRAKAQETVLQAISNGATLKDAAAAAGVTPPTVQNWRKTAPDFAERLAAILYQEHVVISSADQVPPPKARRDNGHLSKDAQAKAKAMAAAALRQGHTRADAAKLAGVVPQTVKYWLTHDPEFLSATQATTQATTQAQPELF